MVHVDHAHTDVQNVQVANIIGRVLLVQAELAVLAELQQPHACWQLAAAGHLELLEFQRIYPLLILYYTL